MLDFWELFRKNLRQRRMEANMSQQTIANYLKITRSAYTCYETGKSKPSLDTVARIAKILGVPLSSLLPKDDEI